jgi:hypothetical protein
VTDRRRQPTRFDKLRGGVDERHEAGVQKLRLSAELARGLRKRLDLRTRAASEAWILGNDDEVSHATRS